MQVNELHMQVNEAVAAPKYSAAAAGVLKQ
jgi:hypothetical protein